jgi:hypothetical protein
MKTFKQTISQTLDEGSIADSYCDRLRKCFGKDHVAFHHVHSMMSQSRNVSDAEACGVAHRITGTRPSGSSKRAALRHLMMHHTQQRHALKEAELAEGEKLDALKLAWRQHRAIQKNYVHGNEPNKFKRAAKNAAYYGKYAAMAGGLHGLVHAGTGSHKLAAVQSGAFAGSMLLNHGHMIHQKYKKNLINARRQKAKAEGRWPVKEE